MGSPGYVYVLLNQSLPGCVKIGKTIRDPAARAAELSSATGVPTPFAVAYDAYFNDCDHAEAYIHALLEVAGVRLAGNREFFSISPTEAINAVIRAQKKLVSTKPSQVDDSLISREHEQESTEPWEQVLLDAHGYLYGIDDVLQDKAKAVERFKIAARLGSEEAYIQLGNLYADAGDHKQGLDWIKRGAEKDFLGCWIELASIYHDGTSSFNIDQNIENAVKCYRRFFEIATNSPARFDSEGSKFYAILQRYLHSLKLNRKLNMGGHNNERDIVVLHNFISAFQAMLLSITDESEAEAKIRELTKLLSQHQLS